MQTTGVLVVDTARLLDESKAGAGAAQALQARWQAATAKHTGRSEAAEAALQKARVELEAARGELRDKLLARARTALAAVLKKRGAAVVIEASAALAYVDGADVTDEVMAAVDKLGPL